MELLYRLNTIDGSLSKSEKGKRKRWKKIATLLLVASLIAPELPLSNGNTVLGRALARIATEIILHTIDEEAQKVKEEVTTFLPDRPNLYKRSFMQILTDGINEYKLLHPETKLHWQRSPIYATDYVALLEALKPVSEDEVAGDTDASMYVGSRLREHLFSFSNGQLSGMDSQTKAVFLSVMVNRLAGMRSAYGTSPIVNGTALDQENANELMITAYYEQEKTEIETLYEAQLNKEPLAQSKLLVYFLEKTHGDIATALAEMTGFFKYMTRGINPEKRQFQIDWLIQHVRDQQNIDYSFNDAPDTATIDATRRSAIESLYGALYHQYNLIELLDDQSPTVIIFALLYQYQDKDRYYAVKEQSDLWMSTELNGIVMYLQGFS